LLFLIFFLNLICPENKVNKLHYFRFVVSSFSHELKIFQLDVHSEVPASMSPILQEGNIPQILKLQINAPHLTKAAAAERKSKKRARG
jgi:hypothetical protein